MTSHIQAEKYHKQIKGLSAVTGLSMAEVLSVIIDRFIIYLDSNPGDVERLMRDKGGESVQ
jgi:hypothetical protein